MIAVALEVALRPEEFLRFLGYGGSGHPSPSVARLLPETLDEARALLRPQGLFRVCPPSDAGSLGLSNEEGRPFALGLATIGEDLEAQVTARLREGESTRALLLDAAGSAAAEEAAEALERTIAAHEGWSSATPADAPRDVRAFRRFSPGYGKWPVTAQRPLFRLLPGDAAGITLLPSNLMVPRKSVSFALWAPASALDPRQIREGEDLGGSCPLCRRSSCSYRKESGPPEESTGAREDP
jgi:hypothetical protein